MVQPHDVLLSRPQPLDELGLDDHLLLERLCDEFEVGWARAEEPPIDKFLHKAPPDCQALLLRELWAVERHYRRDESGQPLTEAAFCALHPHLHRRLEALAIEESRERRSHLTFASGQEIGKPREGDQRELHIRCPHCRNAVELLNEASADNVECQSCGSQFSLVDQSIPSGVAEGSKALGRFDLISRVGVGGFGAVWKARDTELDRVVALKIPRKERLGRREVELFLREARSAAQLRHPNIVPVFEVCHEDDTLFIVSEFVEGVSLAEWMSEGPRSAREVAELCVPLAEALQAAHAAGVVHRDLKPANAMLDAEGRLRLMDFGLAKREASEVTMTFDGQVLGTPAYMSPEQARGEGRWIDRRTDIYSLGVMLFHLLTGELPFRGSVSTQIHQRMTADPPDPRFLDPTIPLDIATICLKCMDQSPNRRYATAAELADELRRFLEGRPIQARPISRIRQTARWAKRKPFQALTLSLGLMLAIGGPVAALFLRAQNREISRRLAERNTLVVAHEADRVRLQKETQTLREQLSNLTGGAAPALPVEPWRVELTRSLLAERLEQYDAQARAMPAGEERSAVYLSLARLLQAAEQPDHAADHYRSAMQSIPLEAAGSAAEPKDFAVAIWSGLYLGQIQIENQDVEEAAQTLAEVRRLIHRSRPGDGSIGAAIDTYATELLSVAMGDHDEKVPRLLKADAVRRSLETRWPEQATELPELTKRLLGEAW